MTTAARLTAQLLAGPRAGDVSTVAERLLAIQAQDPRGARLAIRARTQAVTAADVDRALSVDGRVVVTWLNRGTLHLVRAEDYAWLHGLTAPRVQPAVARRLGNLGIDANLVDRGVDVIERALASSGPLTRAQLGGRLRAAGVPTDGQALIHLLAAASLRGICVRGPMLGRQHGFVLVRDWLPGGGRAGGVGRAGRSFDRDRSLAELARRYLAGHGPATEQDLAKWSGLPLRDARSGLRAIAAELTQVPGGPPEAGLVDLRRRRPAAPRPRPRLLGSFEPVLLGWTSRRALLGVHEPRIVTGGMFRPFALVDGRAAGTWALRGSQAMVEPFEPLPAAVASELAGDAADVERFLFGSGSATRAVRGSGRRGDQISS